MLKLEKVAEWFDPLIIPDPQHPVIDQARDYLASRKIKKHPFFGVASHSRDALMAWTTQELVVTNPFAQELCGVASQLGDLRLFWMMLEVSKGEHGRLSPDGIARNAHPMLLDGLRESMEIPPDDVKPFPETLEFLRYLHQECDDPLTDDPLTGVAALGVGNELMILDEYAAIEDAFSRGWPNARYRPFLRANIAEDSAHSQIMADIGAVLIDRGADPQVYFDAAKRSVDARFAYYDALLKRVQS